MVEEHGSVRDLSLISVEGRAGTTAPLSWLSTKTASRRPGAWRTTAAMGIGSSGLRKMNRRRVLNI